MREVRALFFCREKVKVIDSAERSELPDGLQEGKEWSGGLS